MKVKPEANALPVNHQQRMAYSYLSRQGLLREMLVESGIPGLSEEWLRRWELPDILAVAE